MADLVYCAAMLSKYNFTKTIGIEPIFMKHLVPMFGQLLESKNKTITLAVIKALGTFIHQAQVTPVRMASFYKEMSSQKIVMTLVNMVKPMTNIADPLQIACIHVLSVLVNPVYGDIFSFPWNRGPHDGINEYLEAVNFFEDARKILTAAIIDFDLLKCLLTAFHSEDESQHLETKVAVLRIVSQLLRTPRDLN